jgi:hypothetical protein
MDAELSASANITIVLLGARVVDTLYQIFTGVLHWPTLRVTVRTAHQAAMEDLLI